MEYLKSYRLRCSENNETLLKLANELTTIGYTVFIPKSYNITFIKILHIDKQCTLTFNEVPYRWTITTDIKHNSKIGSSIILTENFNNIFSIDDIIKNMHLVPIPVEKYIEKQLLYLEIYKKY